MRGLTQTVAGVLAIAAVSTAADFVWATWIIQPQTAHGLVHGAVLFLAIGLVLGLVTNRPAAGAAAGLIAGLLAAGTFYLLSPAIGFSAMFVAWFGVWVALAFVYAWLQGTRAGTGTAVSRGIVAAIGSGLAFYLISGIWRPFNPEGLDYLVHFGAWTAAYLPGFAALLLSRR